MIEWSKLHHAYGSAADVPDMLDRIQDPKRSKKGWEDIWSALCHQGDVFEASYAAAGEIGALALDGAVDFNEACHFVGVLPAFWLPKYAGKFEKRYRAVVMELAAEAVGRIESGRSSGRVVALLTVVAAQLCPDDVDKALRVFDLFWDNELDVTCPSCEDYVSLEVDDDGEISFDGNSLLVSSPQSHSGFDALAQILMTGGEMKLGRLFGQASGTVTCPSCSAAFKLDDNLV